MIRKYQDSDCDAVIDAWFAASRVATPFLSDTFLAAERENIRNVWLPRAETWVIEDDGDVVGFIALIGNEVGGLFVHPDFHGSGKGRALMDHAVRLRGALYLDVFEDNAIGRRFYDGYGFQLERRYRHEESGNMQLRLMFRPG